jgi:hypothetical protein
VAGLILGGVVVTANLFGLTWRPVFAINVPLGIILALAVPRLVPPDPPRSAGSPQAAGSPRARLDLAGLMVAVPAVLMVAVPAVLMVVLPLVLGREAGWPAWCFGGIAAGAVLAVIFVLVERRVASRGGEPLLHLAVLRTRALPSGLAALALTQVGYGGLLFAFTLYLEAGLGQSPLRAGLTYLPMAATFGLAGFCWRRWPPAALRIVVPIGQVVSTVGYLGLANAVRSGAGPLAWSWLAVAGVGLGLSVSPLLTQALAHVPAARAAPSPRHPRPARGSLQRHVRHRVLPGRPIRPRPNRRRRHAPRRPQSPQRRRPHDTNMIVDSRTPPAGSKYPR